MDLIKINSGLRLFAKSSVLDVIKGSEYAFDQLCWKQRHMPHFSEWLFLVSAINHHQKRIWNPAEHLWWNFFVKTFHLIFLLKSSTKDIWQNSNYTSDHCSTPCPGYFALCYRLNYIWVDCVTLISPSKKFSVARKLGCYSKESKNVKCKLSTLETMGNIRLIKRSERVFFQFNWYISPEISGVSSH